MRWLLLSSCLVACTVASDPPVEPLPPLPPPATVETDRFRDAEACGQCHLVADDTAVLHDATGANDSPVLLWRSSMMALAARDPFYLAVFAEELERAPDRRTEIETLCARCHAPAGTEELAVEGGHLSFDDMVGGTSPAAVLGRGGITCTLCHQIDPANLGDERSFSGNFVVGFGRALYGRYRDPMTNPMQLIVNFTPTFGDHIGSSELCATCHSVVVPGPSGKIVEQATYLEWKGSAFAADRPCQFCHVPSVDDGGATISTAVASFPADLLPRTPLGRHTFVGGNAYMLELMADAIDWVGAGVPAEELRAAAQRDKDHLAGAAMLTVTKLADGFTVRVDNRTGHKLPTGYPSRRLWLHVTVTNAGATVFESGAVDAAGTLLDAQGAPLAAQPHRDELRSADEVQVWEARLVDGKGTPTHRATDATRYAKDDRILPLGFVPAQVEREGLDPVGVVADATFVGGSDSVTYRVPAIPAGAQIAIELQYQTLAPSTVDAVAATKTPASLVFVDLATRKGQAPTTIARATLTW
ncbi:MAG TPA: hypothetical protein VFQ53_01200 [Kofleriaceae bacterium]|nr:hypothetical protein [Kofleriaceae bacterium]